MAIRKKAMPVPPSIWQNPLHFVAFGFGTGAIPFAPGTFGTLMAIPFYLVLARFSLPFYLISVLIITLFSMWLCDQVSRDLKVHDHPGMCLDEFPGFLVTMIGAPHGIRWILCGFILFRLFDIFKPWPIRYLDTHVKGGFGMVIDDVVAGFFSFIVLHLLFWIF